MCGFAGFIDRNANPVERPVRLELASRMGRQLARRGPDEERLFDDGRLSFVFRRLSIIDLETGSQPIWNEDGTIFVAVNGEIYNHRELRSVLREQHHFRTRSDSEILLHLYEERGPEALKLLNGMFAVTIWDAKAGCLVLARDRLGIKPLFYSRVGEKLLFGSELKALLVHPECPRLLSWRDMDLQLLSLHQPRTVSFVEGIEALSGGHYLTWGVDGQFRETTYWSIADHVANVRGGAFDARHYVERYAELFEDSVRGQLMSDVPVGIFLSGGVDSCAVAAVAAKHRLELQCFSIVDEAIVKSGDARAARTLAAQFDLPLHQVRFDPERYVGSEAITLETLEYLVWAVDSPRFNPEFLLKHELHRYAKTVMPDLKVVLLGQGADEFSGGYSTPQQRRRPHWEDYLGSLRKTMHHDSMLLQHVPQRLRSVLSDAYELGDFAFTNYCDAMCGFATSLQHWNLWYEDRISSTQGVEARVPFLDHRLVELLASVPLPLHKELFWDKAIVRSAAMRWIPEDLARREKVVGVSGPDPSSLMRVFGSMVVTIFPKFVEKYLDSASAIFSRSKLDALLQSAMSGDAPLGSVLSLIGECMVVSIFHRMCCTLHIGFDVRTMDPPSPLEAMVSLEE